MNWSSLGDEPVRPRVLSRRGFLRASAAGCVLAAGAGVYACAVEPHWIAVESVVMPLLNLPPHWAGRRVVQISDLHIGPQVDASYLLDAFARIDALQPDLLLITGDFQTAHRSERIDDVWRVLRHLNVPPRGCYAVFGNHDYGRSWRDRSVADALHDRLDSLNIGVLRNQHRNIDGLTVAGADELWSDLYDARAMLGAIPSDAPVIAMSHNPDSVDGPEWRDFRGWILSGHTHGGQCRAPFLPPPLLPVVNRNYVAGSYDVGPARTLYINRGLGHSWQVRFNARPEITLFTLAAA